MRVLTVYGAAAADTPQIQQYLHGPCQLGRDFAVAAVPPPVAAEVASSSQERGSTMALEAFPTVSAEELRRRSVANLLRMGHCAPTVMQTMLATIGEVHLPGVGNVR